MMIRNYICNLSLYQIIDSQTSFTQSDETFDSLAAVFLSHSDTRCLFTPTSIYCNWIVLLGTLQVILCYLLTSHCRYSNGRKPQTATRLRPPRLKEHHVDFHTQNCINFFVLRGKQVARALLEAKKVAGSATN